MQALANLANAVADAIAVLLPAACYLSALGCFLAFGWTLWRMGQGDPTHRHRPWVPLVALLSSGVFASFPAVLTMANVSAGSGLVASLTSYAPTEAGGFADLLGATPGQTVVNVVGVFRRFFQMFGAGAVFFAIHRWRAIGEGRVGAAPFGCGVQFVFGVLCINVVMVARGLLLLLGARV